MKKWKWAQAGQFRLLTVGITPEIYYMGRLSTRDWSGQQMERLETRLDIFGACLPRREFNGILLTRGVLLRLIMTLNRRGPLPMVVRREQCLFNMELTDPNVVRQSEYVPWRGSHQSSIYLP